MKKYLCFLFLILILDSCIEKSSTLKDTTSDALENILIDVNKVDRKMALKSSGFIEKIDYIPLETMEGVLIGKINKVVSSNGMFFIQDKLTPAVYVFDNKGKHLSTLAAIGGAEGEYLKIDAFCVDPKTNDILIFDGIKRLLLTYNSSGKFLNSKKINLTLKSIAKLDNSLFLNPEFFWNLNYFKNFPNQSQIVMLSDKSDETKSYFDYRYNDFLMQYPCIADKFSMLNDTLIYIDDVGQRVFSLSSDGKIRNKYYIDFGGFNSPLEFTEINSKDKLELFLQAKKENRLATIWSFNETNDHISIGYSIEGIIMTCFISKVTKETVNVPILIYDRDGIQISTPISNTDSSFISYVDAYQFKENCKNTTYPLSDKVRKINDSLNVIDNPILLIYKMKTAFYEKY